ncbi:S-layer homology domain-containing protein [Paenibacillus sp. TRM 82003]|nr:S-layer homology domain-containing protein [Paenibacillus sp. TRM 82003]
MLIVAMILSSISLGAFAPKAEAAGTKPARGTGTMGDPYIVTTPAELAYIGTDATTLGQHYRLGAPIDLSGWDPEGNGAGWMPIGRGGQPFRGMFDGNGYLITGLQINRPTLPAVGLFGYSSGTVKNTYLEIGGSADEPHVVGGQRVGGLIGSNNGEVLNSYSKGSVASASASGYIGGLVGSHERGRIANSYADSDVKAGTSNHYAGGLTGYNYASVIGKSYALGDVVNGGGLSGFNEMGEVYESYTAGNVTGGRAGGLFGRSIDMPSIYNVYVEGNVSGDRAGGVSAQYAYANEWGKLQQVLLFGSVSGTAAHIVADSKASLILLSRIFYDSEKSPSASAANGGTAKTAAELASAATYASFDPAIWDIADGRYPMLKRANLLPIARAVGVQPAGLGSTLAILAAGELAVDGDPDSTLRIATAASNDESVAAATVVDGRLSIEGRGVGETTVTATVVDNKGAEVVVTVPVVGFKAATTPLVLTHGDGARTVSVDEILDAAHPTDWTIVGVSSSDAATVSAGAEFGKAKLEAKGPGTATIDIRVRHVSGGETTVPLLATVNPAPAPSIGSGTDTNPYVVTTAEELAAIGTNAVTLSKSYRLGADIDLTGWDPEANGAGWIPIGTAGSPFTGTFDGRGYEIRGLRIHRPGLRYVGLFGYARSAEIRNVFLPDVTSDSEADIRGSSYAGGLAGALEDATISNSYSALRVSTNTFGGGLVGSNQGSIHHSYASGEINGGYSGGLVGRNESLIHSSYSTALVDGGMYLGGLVGRNDGQITESFSSGNVYGESYLGGLIGHNVTGDVTDAYSSGELETWGYDGFVGGMAAFSNDASISVFRRVAAFGSADGGNKTTGMIGGPGSNDEFIDAYWDSSKLRATLWTPATGAARSTVSLQTASTFAGFDSDVWDIADGRYPRLRRANMLPIARDVETIAVEAGETTALGAGALAVDGDPDSTLAVKSAAAADASVVSVSVADGQLSIAGVGIGETTLTAAVVDNNGAEILVTMPVVGFRGAADPMTLTIGDATRFVTLAELIEAETLSEWTVANVSSDAAAVASAVLENGNVKIQPHAVGTATIQATVKHAGGGVYGVSFLVTVKRVNAAPVARTVPEQKLVAGDASVTLTADELATDADAGETLTVTAAASADAAVATASAVGGALTIAPVGAGATTVTASVYDNAGAMTNVSVAVRVEAAIVPPPPPPPPPPPLNQAPVANVVPAQELTAGGAGVTLTAQQLATDADAGDALSVRSATSADAAVATASVESGELRVAPVGPGATTVTATVYDAAGAMTTAIVAVRVSAAASEEEEDSPSTPAPSPEPAIAPPPQSVNTSTIRTADKVEIVVDSKDGPVSFDTADGGVRVTIPQGALLKPTRVLLERTEGDEAMSNGTYAISPTWRLTTDGAEWLKSATLDIRTEDLPEGVSHKQLALYRWVDGTYEFQAMAGTPTGADAGSIAISAADDGAWTVAVVEPGFSDVPSGHWAFGDIVEMFARGAVNGYPDGEFRPEATVTRAEFVTMLLASMGYTSSPPNVSAGGAFADVGGDEWYAAAMQAAYGRGWLRGDATGAARPNAPITRQELAALLERAAALPAQGEEAEENVFRDEDEAADWAQEAIRKTVRSGLFQGYPDGTFRPGGALSRAEAAKALRGLTAASSALAETGEE